MTIRHKILVNLSVFIAAAMYLAYRELRMMHPDLITFLDLKM